MKTWTRYKFGNGRIGFGTIEHERIYEYDGDMFGKAYPTGASFIADMLTTVAPCQPGKVIALWNNFHALAAKLEKPAPAHPMFLIKPSTSLAGPGDAIQRPRSYSGKIAYEGELGIVIGKRCRNVSVSAAAECIFGYTCVNDVTASELLNEDPNFPQWCRAKGFDTFCCIGPVIVNGLDWASEHVVTRVDGAERQNYPLSDMIFSPEQIVSMLSEDMTLMPGDVIACGTSIGVGSFKDGSTVEVSIDGIGTLSNTLHAESAALAA